MGDNRRLRLNLPWVESPFFEEELAARELDPETRERARFYREHGYLVLENFIPDDLVAQARSQAAPLLGPGVESPLRSEGRYQDAWIDCPAVRELALYRPILDLLRTLYDREPLPFQTLSFDRGTQQKAHADSLHFSSFPRRFLCGVWVALEDMDGDNGPLYYYPGSNRLAELDYNDLGLRYINHNRPLAPYTYEDYDVYEALIEDFMETEGLEPREFHAPKGSVLIWSSELVHGGRPVRNPERSRWSQVTHYYFADCLYYTPMLSNSVAGDLYLKSLTNVATGEPLEHSYYGLPLPPISEDGAYKLMLDVDDQDHDIVRLWKNSGIKQLEAENRHLMTVENVNLRAAKSRLEAAIRDIERSPSHRLARLLTAPLRALRRR